ncbi:MAG: metal ABC transporter ATP-binding protein [Desulfocucumaceae bacterium]
MNNMSNAPAVEINNLSFTYGCHPVLEGVSLTIMPGEAVGITGPNGAGKTTLMNLLVGQLPLQKGEIKFYGHGVATGRWRKRVGYVPQRASNFNQAFPATVIEVVLSGRTSRRGLFRGFNAGDYKAAVGALEIMGLDSLKDNPIAGLSGGQQQRAFIARALAADPEILIMDEPTVGVDLAAKQKLYSILKELNREQKMTMIIVSHDIEGIAGFCTRQVCLNLHLCTCNSWDITPGGIPADNCSGLFPVYSNGRV